MDHPARGTKPVFLINALYQENPDFWVNDLRRIEIISARDGRSARDLSRQLGQRIDHMPDLTLCEGPLDVAGHREGLVIGDSKKRRVTRRLERLARIRGDATFVPTAKTRTRISTKRRNPVRRALGSFVENMNARVARWRGPEWRFFPDEAGYAEAIAGARLHVTGRFHGVCFSMLTATPFLCLTSNSWKVEALLEDAGLSRDRLRRLDGLSSDLDVAGRWDFSPAERVSLSEFLDRAVMQSDDLMSRIARTLHDG